MASVMKRWAVGWAPPPPLVPARTGITSEKPRCWLCGAPVGDGNCHHEFSGKELVRSEPDASSFPSGGLVPPAGPMATPAWDPTSYAVKDDVLCIPTAGRQLHRRGTGQKDLPCCAP